MLLITFLKMQRSESYSQRMLDLLWGARCQNWSRYKRISYCLLSCPYHMYLGIPRKFLAFSLNYPKNFWLFPTSLGLRVRLMKYVHVYHIINPFNADVSFVQCTRTQIFLKTKVLKPVVFVFIGKRLLSTLR